MKHEIVSVTEIAERLGVNPGTVHKWRQRYPDFPAPLKVLAVGPIWDWFPVAMWAARTGRL